MLKHACTWRPCTTLLYLKCICLCTFGACNEAFKTPSSQWMCVLEKDLVVIRAGEKILFGVTLLDFCVGVFAAPLDAQARTYAVSCQPHLFGILSHCESDWIFKMKTSMCPHLCVLWCRYCSCYQDKNCFHKHVTWVNSPHTNNLILNWRLFFWLILVR